MISTDARHYARLRYRFLLADLLGGLVFLWWYQWSGWSATTVRWVRHVTSIEVWCLLGYLTLFGGCSYLVFLPLHFAGDFLLEHRFGLSRLTLARWAIRELKHVLVSGALGLLLVEGFYAILRAAPTRWTIDATIGWVIVSVVLARIFPTVLLPIFYKTHPMPTGELVDRLLALCQRVRLPVLGVFRMDFGVETRKANAALAGLGRSRRVLLTDTLLEHFTPDEIETVLAHELGHQRYRHITKLLILSAIGSWLAFSLIDLSAPWWINRLGLQGLADIAGFPALMLSLSLIGLAGLPIQNALSRHFEWQSDRFAVTTTDCPQAFASALQKLGDLNLADPHPPAWIVWLFYDHPPIRHRIAAAESWHRPHVQPADDGAGSPGG